MQRRKQKVVKYITKYILIIGYIDRLYIMLMEEFGDNNFRMVAGIVVVVVDDGERHRTLNKA